MEIKQGLWIDLEFVCAVAEDESTIYFRLAFGCDDMTDVVLYFVFGEGEYVLVVIAICGVDAHNNAFQLLMQLTYYHCIAFPDVLPTR